MAQRDSVVVGDQWPDFFGGMVVTECRPDSLHVRAAQIFPVICVIVGFTALGLLVQRVAQLMPERNVLDALFSGGTVNKVLFAIAVAGIIFGGVRLGLTYTFDGASRTFIIHRFLIAVSTRHADQFDSVDLSVTHEGPTELLTLSLTRPNGKKAVVLCQTNSRDGVPLAAAAPKIAALLQLPIIRHGTTHQSDESTQVALDAVQSEAHAGDGRDLLINCPSCHAQNANAVAYDAREKAWGIAVHTTTWVKCLTCNTKLFSKRNADELKGLSAKELEPIIVVYRSFYSKAFAVLAVITCIIPFLGVFTGLLASLFNFRRRGWLRRLSFASLLISIVPTLFILNTI